MSPVALRCLSLLCVVMPCLWALPAVSQPAVKPAAEDKKPEVEKELEKDINVIELSRKKTPEPVSGRKGLGIRMGIMPVNSLSYTESGGDKRGADMDMALGLGADAEYRWQSWLILAGEVMLWSVRIEDYGTKAATYEPKDSDVLLNIGAGAKFPFYRSRKGKFNVYARLILGLSHYFGDEDNPDVLSEDRTGLSFGGGVGVDRRFFKNFKVFADSGLYWHKFFFLPYEEDSAGMFTWQVNMGLLFNFD